MMSNIYKQIDEIQHPNIFDITYDDETGIHTVVTGATLLNRIKLLYGVWSCREFEYQFKLYVDENKHNLIQLYKMMIKPYDLENFDKYVESYTDTQLVSTSTTNGKQTTKYSEKDYAENIVTNATQTETDSYTDSVTPSYIGDNEHNNIYYEHSHGNIGVQTNAQILSYEFNVRFDDVILNWIKTFMNKYCWCVWGD